MTKSKIILLLMFCASVSTAFAKAPMKASNLGQREKIAQATKPSSCQHSTGGSHNARSPRETQTHVASLLGTASKVVNKNGKAIAVR